MQRNACSCGILLKQSGGGPKQCTGGWPGGFPDKKIPPSQCCNCKLDKTRNLPHYETSHGGCDSCKTRRIRMMWEAQENNENLKQALEEKSRCVTSLEHEVTQRDQTILQKDAEISQLTKTLREWEETIRDAQDQLKELQTERDETVQDAQKKVDDITAAYFSELRRLNEEKAQELSTENKKMKKQISEELHQLRTQAVVNGDDDLWLVLSTAVDHRSTNWHNAIEEQLSAGVHKESELLFMIQDQCKRSDKYKRDDNEQFEHEIGRARENVSNFVMVERDLATVCGEISDAIEHVEDVASVPDLVKLKDRRKLVLQQLVASGKEVLDACTAEVKSEIEEQLRNVQNVAIPQAKAIQKKLGDDGWFMDPCWPNSCTLMLVTSRMESWRHSEEEEASARHEETRQAMTRLAGSLRQCALNLETPGEREGQHAAQVPREEVRELAASIRKEVLWHQGCGTRFGEEVAHPAGRACLALLDELLEEERKLAEMLAVQRRAEDAVRAGAEPEQGMRMWLQRVKEEMRVAELEDHEAASVLRQQERDKEWGHPVDESARAQAREKQRNSWRAMARLHRQFEERWARIHQLQSFAFPELPLELAKEFKPLFKGVVPQGVDIFSPFRTKAQYQELRKISSAWDGDSRNNVFRALWCEPGGAAREVALKEFKLSGDKQRRVRVLQREVNALQRMAHSNIIEAELFFLDWQDHDGGCLYGYVQFRLYDMDMRKWLQTEEAAVRDHVLVVLLGVLRGLEHVHYHCVVHCDVKPANVLLGPPEPDGVRRAVLADFDLSLDQRERRRQCSMASKSASVVGPRGTPGRLTIAPEVAHGEEPTAASDLFSFGGLVLEAMFKDAASTWSQLSDHECWSRDGEPRLAGEAGGNALVRQLLSNVPRKRPTASAALSSAMFSSDVAVGKRERERELAVMQQEKTMMEEERARREQERAAELAALCTLEGSRRREEELRIKAEGELAGREAELAQLVMEKEQVEANELELQRLMGQVVARSEAEERQQQKEIEQLTSKRKELGEKAADLETEVAKQKLKRQQALARERQLEAELRGLREEVAQSKVEQRRLTQEVRQAQRDGVRVPPYWKHHGKGHHLVPNTKFMQAALQGWLRESADLSHGCQDANRMKNAEVTRVQRVEDQTQWETYQNQRRALQRELAELVKNGVTVHALARKTHQPKLQQVQLDQVVNELFLFHGTTKELADIIARDGFDPRVANLGGLYGAGCYFADWSCKSAHYTNPAADGTRVFLLCRVLMGCPHMITGQFQNERRPPTMSGTTRTFDSIFAERQIANGRRQVHNEYVVFERSQVYPEYVVHFKVP